VTLSLIVDCTRIQTSNYNDNNLIYLFYSEVVVVVGLGSFFKSPYYVRWLLVFINSEREIVSGVVEWHRASDPAKYDLCVPSRTK